MWSNRYFWKRKSVIWKLFAVGQRRKCRADFSWVLRLNWVFPLPRDENLSERVCRSCDHKIRNGAELHNFIEQALCSTRVDEDLNCKDLEDRCKRQLPTTITPERSNTKKQLIGTDGFYGLWHLYICRSLFNHSTFLLLHSCLWRFMKGTSSCVIGRNVMLWQILRGHRSTWFLLLSTCRFPKFDISIICHVL